jgi:tyrosyl-tRNA synthetase
MYGKVMSLPDEAMPTYYSLVTRFTPEEIKRIEAGLKEGNLHPRDVKMKLALEVTDIFYGEEDAQKAQETFVKVFQQRELPDEMPEYTLKEGESVLEVLEAGGMIKSRGEGRRLIKQNGVRLDNETLTDPNQPFPRAGILKVGKRRFLRVKI